MTDESDSDGTISHRSTAYRSVRAGISAAVKLALARPARLGATRLVAVDGPSGSGKTSLAAPLGAAFAAALGGTVLVPCRVAVSAAGPVQGAGAPDDPSPTLVPCPAGPGKGVVEPGGPGGCPAGPGKGVVEPGRPGGCPAGPGKERGTAGALVTVVSTDLLATWEHPLDWWPLLERHLLAPLAAGSPARLPVVQWVSGHPRPGGAVCVPPVEVLVLEGVSAGRSAVADRTSALVWVEVPDRADRLERAVARDGEAMRPFLGRWQFQEDAHFAADHTRDRADVLIRAG